MKIYTLWHPELGYVAGKRGSRYFTPYIKYASKWNRQCDATNCRNQTHRPLTIKRTEVKEFMVQIIHRIA